MEIEYLKQLQNNPIPYPNEKEFNGEIKGISESKITYLEQLYNNGNPFPIVLKELLYLAGKSCYVIDWGPFVKQEELQQFVREVIQEENHIITRPFYVFDSTSGIYLFIYLDEGDNPSYHVMDPYEPDSSKWIKKWNKTIQQLVNDGVELVKEGLTPF
ncbi:hypothetical protein [Polluticaenibacter yanchengensis]|uniref:SMI1/KNR4 family protein n=1 Tax=Polluticaenibacter yanchengensis TaxID=3014562 RepID=A0ABT4UM06_9BACT|nr:hypothetical protein [Chitinophagaceae bacterium LY-5]